MKTTITTLTAAAIFAAQGTAAQVCMDPAEMHAALVDWYQESPKGPKKDLGDSKTQLWASSDNDTWTLVRYYTSTSACVEAQGTDVPSQIEVPRLMAELAIE